MPKHQVINPANSEVLYEYNYTTWEEADIALNNLKNIGLKQQKSLSPIQRFETLLKLKELVLDNKEILAKQISLETGKIISESLVEVDRALVTLEYSAEEAKRINGEAQTLNHLNDFNMQFSLTVKKPLGVIFCITPFNFPLNLALHKIGPAFASGNTILLKPSECNFQLANMLRDLCLEAGFPDNTIKIISPEIKDLNEIVKDNRIACISFTGGTKTADKIASLAGRKKLLFELGGNDSLVVFPDGNIDEAVNQTILGRIGTCGQKCTASKRIFIHEDMYNEFKSRLLASIKANNFDLNQSPLDENSNLGPLISENIAKQIKTKIDDSVSRGASVLIGNEMNCAYFSATVIENIAIDDPLVLDETFGPVIPLFKFKDLDELVKNINITEYGLQAGIFTSDLNTAKILFDSIEAGTVAINNGPGFRQEYLPFGGIKNSGMGREGIKYAIDEMTYIKQMIL